MLDRTFQLGTEADGLTLTSAQLGEFAARYSPSADATSRTSELFWVEMVARHLIVGTPMAKIAIELQGLEGSPSLRGTRKATQFVREPLKGLWHKHFYDVGNMARNIENALKQGKADEPARNLLRRYHAGEDLMMITHEFSSKVVTGSLDERRDAEALTGDWIVFAVHEGKNFYLCLGQHEEGDNNIAAKIRSVCLDEFPWLRTYPFASQP